MPQRRHHRSAGLLVAVALWASAPLPAWCTVPETACTRSCEMAPIVSECEGVGCAAETPATEPCGGGACGIAGDPESRTDEAQPASCPLIPRTDDGRLWCILAPGQALVTRDAAPELHMSLDAVTPVASLVPQAPTTVRPQYVVIEAHAPPWAPHEWPAAPRAPPPAV